MPALASHIILCSETQERFMWVCHPDVTPIIINHFNKKFDLPNVSMLAQAKVVGKIVKDPHYTVYANNKKIVDGPIEKINEGFVYKSPTQKINIVQNKDVLPEIKNYNEVLKNLLKNENIASRVPVYECYDKNVQGRTVLERGTSEAGVVSVFNGGFPKEIRDVGFSAAIAHNPKVGKIDPYLTAQHAVLEATAKVVSSGGVPVALTDCLCFGNPEKPEQMWQFAESCRAIKETCANLHFEKNTNLPIVAGNVSFYNQSRKGAIPSSPMIGCFGKNNDVKKSIRNSLQKIGSDLFLLGGFGKELGGSVIVELLKTNNNVVQNFSVKKYSAMLNALIELIDKKLVLSSRVVARGGLGTTLCLMSFKNRVGVVSKVPEEEFANKLFSENLGIVIEANKKDKAVIQKTLETNNIPYDIIGQTVKEKTITVNKKISLKIKEIKNDWEGSLREKLLS